MACGGTRMARWKRIRYLPTFRGSAVTSNLATYRYLAGSGGARGAPLALDQPHHIQTSMSLKYEPSSEPAAGSRGARGAPLALDQPQLRVPLLARHRVVPPGIE